MTPVLSPTRLGLSVALDMRVPMRCGSSSEWRRIASGTLEELRMFQRRSEPRENAAMESPKGGSKCPILMQHSTA